MSQQDIRAMLFVTEDQLAFVLITTGKMKLVLGCCSTREHKATVQQKDESRPWLFFGQTIEDAHSGRGSCIPFLIWVLQEHLRRSSRKHARTAFHVAQGNGGAQLRVRQGLRFRNQSCVAHKNSQPGQSRSGLLVA